MNKISVIVPSYNSWPLVERTLQGLNDQQGRGLLEEILVVDSSDDGMTKKSLSGLNIKGLRLIDAGKKTFPAVARNLGAQQAKAGILAFIDADAYPAPDWLENIARAFDSGCRVGGGRILIPDFQAVSLIPLAQYFLQFNEYMGAQKQVKKFVPSCNLFCDKGLFHQIKGFPQLRASEDVLFGINASKLEKVWFDPGIKVYHVFRTSLRKFLANQELLGEYIIRYRASQGKSKFYYRAFWPVIFLPAFLGIKFCAISLRVFRLGIVTAVKFTLCLPLFLTGLIWWAKGFIKGALFNIKVER